MFIKSFANSGAFIVSLHGVKYAILLSLSTTTHMLSYLSDSGSPVMNSMLIALQGLSGARSGFNKPKGAWLVGLILWHVSQFLTYGSMSFLL